jgi:hypothetical protein
MKKSLLLVALALISPLVHAGWTIRNMGYSATNQHGVLQGVAGDGSIGVGYVLNAAVTLYPTVYERGSGIKVLSTAAPGLAYDASFDGGKVVGSMTASGGSVPFEWTPLTGIVNLGLPTNGQDGTAVAVSSDGTMLACWGHIYTSPPFTNTKAFTWDGSAYTVLAGSTFILAEGVSGDGSLVVGTDHSGGEIHAKLWLNGAQSSLAEPAPSGFNFPQSRATDVSDDGAACITAMHVFGLVTAHPLQTLMTSC